MPKSDIGYLILPQETTARSHRGGRGFARNKIATVQEDVDANHTGASETAIALKEDAAK